MSVEGVTNTFLLVVPFAGPPLDGPQGSWQGLGSVVGNLTGGFIAANVGPASLGVATAQVYGLDFAEVAASDPAVSPCSITWDPGWPTDNSARAFHYRVAFTMLNDTESVGGELVRFPRRLALSHPNTTRIWSVRAVGPNINNATLTVRCGGRYWSPDVNAMGGPTGL